MGIKEVTRKFMSHKEYEANLAGLNIVFGAMIGVIMGNIEDMSGHNYALLLVVISGFVVTILYISASKHRLIYALSAAALLFVVWANAKDFEIVVGIDADLLEQRLIPVGTVWLIMVSMIEFLPRGHPEN